MPPEAAAAELSDDIFESTPTETDPAALIPEFDKLKKTELVNFVVAMVGIGKIAVDAGAELSKLKVPDLKQALKEQFPHPDSLETPDVTGFDPNAEVDPVSGVVAKVQGLTSESEAISYIGQLQDESQYNFFKIGGALSEMLSKGWMGEYDDFGSFVEAEFGFRLRKAQNLISIYGAVTGCGATWDEIKDIGWSKLSVIATSLLPDTYKDWFEKVDGLTYTQTQELVKQNYADEGSADAGAESTPNTTMKFVVHTDQVETIKSALEKAKVAGGTEYEGPALEWICLDFLATPKVGLQLDKAQGVKLTGEEMLTIALFDLLKESSDPMAALETGIATFEAGFAEAYPDLETDIYINGKPDELAGE